jgi:hypothetical protein
MSHLSGKDALSESKYLKMQAESSRFRADIFKTIYLLELEKCLLAGDAGLREFIEKDHDNLTKSICDLEKEAACNEAEAGILASQANVEQAENIQSTKRSIPKKHRKKTPQRKTRLLGKRLGEGPRRLQIGWGGLELYRFLDYRVFLVGRSWMN